MSNDFFQDPEYADIKNPRTCCKLYFNLIPDSAAQCLQNINLHGIIYVKSYLIKIKVFDGYLCSFCGECPESTGHYFLFCKVVRPLLITIKHVYSQQNSF